MNNLTRHTLPRELDARLAEVESAARHNDFDSSSWFWMILLGVVVPAGLIVAGWLYEAGAHSASNLP
jgi:hypothetical protein